MGRDFKKLDIYQIAYNLVLSIYKLLGNFPAEENHNLADQLRRCASSIPLNIAEGSGSHSNKVHLTYLGYAYKSSKELEVILDLSLDLGFIPADEHVSLLDKLEELRAKLYRYMQRVEKEIKENRPNFEYWREKFE